MTTPNKLSNNQSAKNKKNPVVESNSTENKKNLVVDQKPIEWPVDFLEEGITEGNQISVENLNSENDA